MRLSLLMVALSVRVATAAPSAHPQGGVLIVSSTTDGAAVLVDGERLGVTPIKGAHAFPFGEHTIKVTKPGFAPLIDVFVITKKKNTVVTVDLQPVAAVLNVNSNITGARIFVDGKFVGEAPLSGAEVEPGTRSIKVQKGGYRDYVKSVEGVAGQEIVLDAQLEELPIGLNPYKPVPPPAAKWYEKWWVWTAAVGGAAIVVTAIVVPIVVVRDPVKSFGPDVQITGP